LTSGSADAVRERFIVPESRVLEYEPATRFADAAPTFPFVSVISHPTRSIQIAVKPEVLLVGYEIGIRWIHIFWWRRDLFVVKASVQVRRVRKIGEMRVKMGMRVCVTLQHAEDTMRHERRRLALARIHE